jgi:hypothetical protein
MMQEQETADWKPTDGEPTTGGDEANDSGMQPAAAEATDSRRVFARVLVKL